MFIFPSDFCLPHIVYIVFEGYINDTKTGNMGLNVCGAHLSLPAHDIVVVTFHLEKSPPQAPPPQAQVKLLMFTLARLLGHNENWRNSHTILKQ